MKQLPIIERAFPLDDIEIVRGGTGRTVTAYAAVYDSPYEVRDFEGHYFEQIHRSSFNRWLQQQPPPICLYNHGFMLGTTTPSDRFGMPLGTPVSIRSETRGLLTVTEYAKTPLADEVLELIRSGAITGQSFRGPIFQSRPAGARSGLRIVERMQLGIRDYGPTPAPVAREAEIVGIRSQVLLEQLRDLTDEEREELLAQLSDAPTSPDLTASGEVPPPDGPPADPDAPIEPVAETPPEGPSIDLLALAQEQRRRRQP